MCTDSALFEFCAENFTHVPCAIAAGARRIELCDNLAVGGTSPSAGVIEATVAYAHAHEAHVMAMVRPRGGDFVFTEEEVQMMEADARAACELGVDGIVIGCLVPRDVESYAIAREAAVIARALPGEGPQAYTAGYDVDYDTVDRLVAIARKAKTPDITFHMAFDALDPADQFEVIDQLAARGITRILTHGNVAGTPIMDNLPRLRELMGHAAGKLTILPGAGITWENAEKIALELGAGELHGTKIVDLSIA